MSKNVLSPRACISKLVKKDELVGHLQCASCNQLLYNAFQTAHGCRLCGLCIENHLGNIEPNSSSICPGKTDACSRPIDGEPLPKISKKNPDFMITPDNATRNEVNRLKVKCPNSECAEITALKLIDKHLMECSFESTTCDKCECELLRKELNEHREKLCSERLVTCEHCKEQLSYRKMQDGHLDLRMDTCCPQFRSVCPFCSEAGPFSRDELENEHKSSCIGYPRNCSFHRINCSFYDSKERIESHEKSLDGMLQHMVLMMLFFFGDDELEVTNKRKKQFKNSRLLNEAASFSHDADENFQSREEVDEFRNQFANLQTAYNKLSQDFQDSSATLTRTNALVRNLFDKFKRMQVQAAIRFENVLKLESMAEGLGGINNINKTMTTLKDSVSKHDDHIRNLQNFRPTIEQPTSTTAGEQSKKNQIETTSFNGRLIWKIDNYSRRKQEAASSRREKTSLYSPPFYTSRYGYKMCARIYINGDGSTENDVISLFFVLMKGEFDDLLDWPFSCKVTLTAMNLRHPNRSKVDMFKPDSTSNSFMKPSSDMNIASGCPRFISHAELESGDFISKEGSLYIKVVVDTSELRDPSEK